MTRLELAYDRARNIIGPESAECFDVVEEVERLRNNWRPEPVKVLLLAESHVWTSPEDFRRRVKQPGDEERGFARFVYCLGYGEPQLVCRAANLNHGDVVGTPQYWRLFHDTVCEPTPTSHNGVKKTGETNCHKRVQNKLDLLRNMQRAGIWLLDASVTPLVREGNRLVTGKLDRCVLKACWESHIRELLCRCKPCAVLIVGKAVCDAIGDDVREAMGVGVEIDQIYQPNARQFGEVDRRKCFNLCCRHRA
jgi:hypothetical protein